jgi:predicted metalloprotease with PDZ domain
MDDVMRLMLERHGGARGFNGRDIEGAVEEVCRCDVTALFDNHVRRGGQPFDFNRYLVPVGWRAEVTWSPAIWENQPERDLRIWGWEPPREQGVRLVVNNPGSIWGKAGLHSRDRLVAINGAPVRTWPELRAVLSRSQMGDTLAFEVMRDSGPFRTTVRVTGYNRPHVRLVNVANPARDQLRLREQWERGT